MRVTIIYPHPSFDKFSGAGLRISLLIEFLRERCDEVNFVYQAEADPFSDGNVHYHPLRPTMLYRSLKSKMSSEGWVNGLRERINSDFVKLAALEAIRRTSLRKRLGACEHELNLIGASYGLRFNAYFQRSITECIKRSTHVFLEYHYWAKAVLPVCKRFKTKTFLTAHDVLSQDANYSAWGRKALLHQELAALRHADYPCTVAPEDAAFFETHGVPTNCIVNPIDFHSLRRAAESEGVPLQEINLNETNFCLFVGSDHPPNRAAVTRLIALAPKLQCKVVVVGSCSPPHREGNFIALGRVNEDILRACYMEAQVVVVPLESGSGSSLKTVEALAMGKAIVSTSVGCRGYALQDGKNVLIRDDFERFIDAINSLVKENVVRQELGKEAVKIAQTYDFRKVYEKYWDLMTSPPNGNAHPN